MSVDVQVEHNSPTLRQPFQLSRAVAQLFRRHAHAIEHAEIEVGERRFFLNADVLAGLERPAAFTGEQNRQLVVVVGVAVADAASQDDHGVVQKRSLAFPNSLQFFQHISELGDVKAINLGNLGLLVFVAAVVR